jgi:hypothetical protein
MTITNTLHAARTTLHHDGDNTTINAAFEGNEGYLVVADADNELDDAEPPLLRLGKARMVTLQSRADQTISFLIPMEDGPSLMARLQCEPAHDDEDSTLHRPLPRTPAQYLAAGDGCGHDAGGAAMYSAPVEEQQQLYDDGEDDGHDGVAADGGAAGAAMYSVPDEAQQELYGGTGDNGNNRLVDPDGATMYSAPDERQQQLYDGEGGGGGGGGESSGRCPDYHATLPPAAARSCAQLNM